MHRVTRELLIDSFAWLRGKAVVDDGWIVLTEPEKYVPSVGSWDMTVAFSRIRTEEDAAVFASQYGLLEASVDTDDERLQEPFWKWLREATIVSSLLSAWIWLQAAIPGHEAFQPQAVERLRSLWPTLFADLAGHDAPKELDDRRFVNHVAVGIGMAVQERLKDAPLEYYVGYPEHKDNVYALAPKTLRALIGVELSMLFSSDVTVRLCEQCGLPFAAHDRRQRYCSEPCANRARYERRIHRASAQVALTATATATGVVVRSDESADAVDAGTVEP